MKKTVILIKSLSFVFVLGIASSVLHAQDRNTENAEVTQDLPKIFKTSELGTFYSDFSGQNVSSSTLASNLGKWLGGQSNDKFEIVKSWEDDLGIKKIMYQHFYKGTKVQDDIIVIHEKDGKVVYVNGEFVKDIKVAVSAALSLQELKNIIALNSEISAENITLSPAENVISKKNTEKGLQLNSSTMVSAYSMIKPIFSNIYYIDNVTKQIANKIPLIQDHSHGLKLPFVDTPSTSSTYYKGNQSVTVDSYNGSYRLMDNARKVWTMNGSSLVGATGLGQLTSGYVVPTINNGTTPVITEYTNSTANFTAAATKAPVEVHWAIQKSNDYFLNRLNRNSFDGLGTPIASYYNVDFSLLSPDFPAGYGANATALTLTASTGELLHFMAFGNGNVPSSPGVFNTFASIDVGGHEYSHLVVTRNGTGGLTYQGESGALNESFADILGTCIEFYASPTLANWTIGEGILNFAPRYLRSMSAPKTGPALLFSEQPDTYNGIYWASTAAGSPDNGGVHTNSGVGNKWFYLLSVGGTGINDNGTAYNVTGLTIQKAEKIAYKTLTGGYLTANSNYLAAYNASKQATIALYGAGSNELQQVENAWCAVGLGNCATFLAVNEATKFDIQDIKIYPNPVTNGQFTIESGLKGNVTYEIYDFSGKLIKTSEKLEKGINKINISGVQAAAYILKININGKIVSKKIIVE